MMTVGGTELLLDGGSQHIISIKESGNAQLVAADAAFQSGQAARDGGETSLTQTDPSQKDPAIHDFRTGM